MKTQTDYDFVIIGGGLAGNTAAILLAGISDRILLVEKKQFPVHKVCGEYISNDVLPIFKSFSIDPFEYGAASINRLSLVAPSGKRTDSSLQPGGFALSRYLLDKVLLDTSAKYAEVKEGESVVKVEFKGEYFEIQLSGNQQITSAYVIGAYGKRSAIDRNLGRQFLKSRSGYLGVKYHVRAIYPEDTIGLYYFQNGYCGIVKIENDLYNLCYLVRKPDEMTNLKDVEAQLLFRNPSLKSLIASADFIPDSEIAIHQIYFEKKEQVKDHVIFCGDAAGLITPLCGNGMAMAMQGAQLLTHIIKKYWNPSSKTNPNIRERIESVYISEWNSQFSSRLAWGRRLQGLSRNPFLTETFLGMMRNLPPLEKFVISKTHGMTSLQ